MRSILFHDSIEQASSGALMVSHGLRIPVNPAQAGSFALLRPYRVSGKARHVKGEFLFARSGQKGGEINASSEWLRNQRCLRRPDTKSGAWFRTTIPQNQYGSI